MSGLITRFAIRFTLIGLLASTAIADHWPQFRGPHGDGIALHGAITADFQGGEARVAWNGDVGVGYSAVAVVNGRLYTAGWAEGHTTVHCLDARTGDPIWQQRYPIDQYDRQHQGGPAGTPAVAGDRIYHLSREAELFCFRATDGAPQWSRRLMEQLGVERPRFAFTGSPIVHGDLVFVDVGRIAAVHRVSGELVWQSDDYGAAYSSPRLFSWQGRAMLAAFPQAGLVVLDRHTGREVATHPWTNPWGNNAVVPVLDDDRLFVSSGDNIGGVMLKLTTSGLTIAWKAPMFRNKMATAVLIDGHLYGFDVAVLKCLDVTDGSVKWTHRGLGKGTITALENTLVVLGEKGELLVADATPAGFVGRHIADILDPGPCWTVPVVAAPYVYCRGADGRLVAVHFGTRSPEVGRIEP